MKKSFGILIYLIVSTATLLAQPPPPPETGNNGGTNGFVGGNTAPIDGGLAVALFMVAGYGAWKLVKALQKKSLANYTYKARMARTENWAPLLP
jgi:hypothetical protein